MNKSKEEEKAATKKRDQERKDKQTVRTEPTKEK